MARRYERLLEVSRSQDALLIELEQCRRSVFHWCNWWPWTYDPREAVAEGLPATQPFDLDPRQVELVQFLLARILAREDGLVEKSRGVGFTWVAAAMAWHKWRWTPGFKTTFGSRKVEYVDRIGDPDSIFEKIRMLMRSMPEWMLPGHQPGNNDPSNKFKWYDHDNHLLIINPENGNTIRGEGGDEMGRGGRSSWYILDESAFYERADRIDASTSSNADVRIWASTVNGPENLFARKRHGGSLRTDQIFRFHYSSNPRVTPEWVARKKRSMELHQWNSEYEIDYSASVEGVCIPAAWIEAAQRIKNYVEIVPSPNGVAGGDIGAGRARSVFVGRFGPVIRVPVVWGDPDTTETAHRLIEESKNCKILRADGWECRIRALRFDAPGVGAGVASTLRRNPIPGLNVIGINTGATPSDTVWPDRLTSKQKFRNLKAELWCTAREAFRKTFETVLWHETAGVEGTVNPADELVCMPQDSESADVITLKAQLSNVRRFRAETGKWQIESKDQLAKRQVQSPDHADAFVLCFTPPSIGEQWAAFGRLQQI